MVALGYLAGLSASPRAASPPSQMRFKGKAAAIAGGVSKAFDAGYAEGQATFSSTSTSLTRPGAAARR
jgi:hypothetical protein